MTKMTISERIDAIQFDTMTEEDFAFLVERAHKSVRPAAKGPRKPSKAQIARQGDLKAVYEFVAAQGTVTCADVMAEFGISSQKAARLLRDAEGVVKATEAKGKAKATWTVA